MSVNITVPMKNTYNRNVRHLAQQTMSRLRGAVTIESGLLGEKHFIEQIGLREPVQRVSRHQDSPLQDQPHSRRLLTLTDWWDGDMVDRPDVIRTLDDPSNSYAVSMARGFGRRYDRTIIAAFNGTSYSGHDGTTANTLAAGNTIQEYYTSTGSGADSDMTVDKLRGAKRILDAFEIDEDGRYIVLGASQVESLLLDSEITSSDFNTVRALVNGEINTFMGFTFIRSELLTASGAVRSCFAWQRDHVVLGEGGAFTTRIEERADKGFDTYVFTKATMGAVRLQENGVVEIQCTEG